MPAPRKRWLMLGALSRFGEPMLGGGAPPLPETRYLVEAVATHPVPATFVRPTVGDHIGRMAEILLAAHARQTPEGMGSARTAGE